MFGLIEALLSFIRRQIGLRTDAASSTGSVHAKLGDIKSTLSAKSAVKSIQRGTHNGGVNDITINISTINPDKAFVLLNGEGVNTGTFPFLKTLTANNFTTSKSTYVTSGTSEPKPFGWQVIEFY